MKQAWDDLKSFVTIAMVFLLFTIVIMNFLGFELEQSILLLATNTISCVITYYFSKSTNEKQAKNVETDVLQQDVIKK